MRSPNMKESTYKTLRRISIVITTTNETIGSRLHIV
jgi:hypothetical protein